MADNLENLVKQAESDISRQHKHHGPGEPKQVAIPKFSIAIFIWIVAISLGAFNFTEIVSMFSTPTEAKIEKALGAILTKTSISLHHYQARNGLLPPLLPNPAIRGLVRYDRRSDYDFQLTATINKVTMTMNASSTSPLRKTE